MILAKNSALNKLAHHFSSAWEMLEHAKLNRLLYCTLGVSNMFGYIMNIQEKKRTTVLSEYSGLGNLFSRD